MCECETSRRERGGLTWIIVRRMTTEPKTGFIGVVLVASLAMLRPLIAIFNAGITLPRPFCRRELSVMVEMQGEWEEAVSQEPER